MAVVMSVDLGIISVISLARRKVEYDLYPEEENGLNHTVPCKSLGTPGQNVCYCE